MTQGLRLTHDNYSALVVQDNAVALHVLGARLDHLGEFGIKGVGKANMADNTSLEEGKRTDALCAIYDLVRNDKVHGLDVLLQRADSREGNDASHSNVSQGCDVGSVGDLVGGELMVNAVSGEKSDVDAFVRENVDG